MTEDRSLTAKDIARIMGVSRGHAYELIKQMPHEQLGPKCVRVRQSDFEAWREQLRKEPTCVLTSGGMSGGYGGPKMARPYGAPRSARTGRQPSSSKSAGSESSPIRSITPRVKRLSKAQPSDSSESSNVPAVRLVR